MPMYSVSPGRGVRIGHDITVKVTSVAGGKAVLRVEIPRDTIAYPVNTEGEPLGFNARLKRACLTATSHKTMI